MSTNDSAATPPEVDPIPEGEFGDAHEPGWQVDELDPAGNEFHVRRFGGVTPVGLARSDRDHPG